MSDVGSMLESDREMELQYKDSLKNLNMSLQNFEGGLVIQNKLQINQRNKFGDFDNFSEAVEENFGEQITKKVKI